MTEDGKKYNAMIRAANINKQELIETGQMKGYAGVYNHLGLEHTLHRRRIYEIKRMFRNW